MLGAVVLSTERGGWSVKAKGREESECAGAMDMGLEQKREERRGCWLRGCRRRKERGREEKGKEKREGAAAATNGSRGRSPKRWREKFRVRVFCLGFFSVFFCPFSL